MDCFNALLSVEAKQLAEARRIIYAKPKGVKDTDEKENGRKETEKRAKESVAKHDVFVMAILLSL